MRIYSERQLKDNEEKKMDEKIDISQELIAANGKKCSSEIVFITAFQHLHREAMKHLKKITKQQIDADEIQWIVTVPAIWTNKAKRQMQQWVYKAGLVSEDIINQCLIVPEPNCASLSIQKERQPNDSYLHIIHEEHEDELSKLLHDNNLYQDLYERFKEDGVDILMLSEMSDNEIDELGQEYDLRVPQRLKLRRLAKSIPETKQSDIMNKHKDAFIDAPLEIGEKYILIDAGGGTVDVSCHQIKGEYEVDELYKPSGGPWGSCYIDDEYIKLLQKIFSKQWIEEFRRAQPNIYVEIIENFQAAKETFYSNSEAEWHHVVIPDDFIGFLEEKGSPNIIIEAANGTTKLLILFKFVYSDTLL